MRSTILLPFLGLMSKAFAAPIDIILNPRAVVAHDSLSPLPTRVQNNGIGKSIVRFNPLLHIAHGCQPYPAVNDAGDTRWAPIRSLQGYTRLMLGTSGGLSPTGTSSGGCRDTSKGQTYARGAWYRGKYAILYAWFFPKDQPINGVFIGSHRFDWESAILLLNNPEVANPTILGAAASGHGNYKKSTNPPYQNDSIKVEYFTEYLLNHALQFTDTVGRTYPVLDWDAMPKAMRNALSNTDFGDANVPFIPANFFNNLDKGFI
ncbi:necrosis inducing protein [Colletotrichum orchidophilum]|uniref:Necrosis inducing protein n=1 Tax=Colletotrichum orchidophilum TaxID=1209926 RepID=A0A1G4AXF4_9PEZI|nr:necrosis inducing protein [Colletotrichum orchidophilum]OHE93840.1 necrosis inducing protein [Colletotrichum orchidophilum]